MYGIKAVCEVLELNSDMYYYYINKIKTTPWYFEKETLVNVQSISDSSIVNVNIGPVYGAQKLADGYNQMTTKQNGNIMTKYIATKVMGMLDIESNYHKKQAKQQKATASEDARYYPNVLKREYTQDINTVVTSDLTYIPSRYGMKYVCFIIDLGNKEIVGYSVSDKHNTECVMAAIDNMSVPIETYKMFHSDRGGEFASKQLQDMLELNELIISMSKPGCPYDNAISENMFKLLKGEGIDDYYKDINKLHKDVSKWVKWYNNVRMHSGLEYKSPKQVRARLQVN